MLVFVVCGSLLVVGCWLLDVCCYDSCLLFVCRSLCVGCCPLFVDSCLLFVGCWLSFAVGCRLLFGGW